jgi:hypothetical protein
MKLTKKRVIFFILHAFFSAVAPIALVIIQYSTIGNNRAAVGFKISITGVLLLIFVFWLVKKLFIDKKLADLRAQSNVMLANLKTKQDPAEISAIERELKSIRTTEAVFGAALPLLFIIAAIVAFKALEAQLIKLSATLCWIAVSFTIGTVFNVLYVRQVKRKGGNK